MTAGRTARAVAALALLLLPALPGATASAGETTPTPTPTALSPRAAPEPEFPVQVEVGTLAPRAPVPGGRLQVRGTLTNTGSRPVGQLRVALRVGDRLASRSALGLADAEGVATRRVRSTVVSLLDVVLEAGASAPFDVRTPVDALDLGGDGAYPLEVEVRGRVDDGAAGDIVGLASTFLPWFATPPAGTTRIAFVWPVAADPARIPRRTDRGPVLLDEDLAASVSPGGRLEGVLRAGRAVEAGACDQRPEGPEGEDPTPAPASCRREPVPLTYALDGDLLDTVAGMAGGYDVRVTGSRVRPGTGSEAARAWTASLREGVAAGAALAVPYADPDVVALSSSTSDLRADVGTAVQLGRTAVEKVTGKAPLPAVTLAPPGALTVGALQTYADTGTRALVVSEQVLPPRPPAQSRTSGARDSLATATGPLTGLVVDEGLSRLLAPDTDPQDGWQGARLAEQRWLVESAMVAAEDPGLTRTLVVAPTRDADLVPAVAAQSMLDAGRLPWLCPVPLADVVTGTEQCPLGGPTGSALERRGAPLVPDDDAPVLDPAQLERVAQTRDAVDQLTQAVLAPSDEAADTRARLLRAVLRTESIAWRDPADRRRGRMLAGLLQDDVDDLLGRVTLLTGPVTLTSSRGRLTVDVENQLDQAVTVRVRLTADNAARLDVQGVQVQQVPARTSVPLTLEAQPRTSGQFPVRAQLLDRRGEPFGATSEFVLRSTRYGSVALAVTGVGAGILLVAAGYRLTRRALGR